MLAELANELRLATKITIFDGHFQFPYSVT